MAYRLHNAVVFYPGWQNNDSPLSSEFINSVLTPSQIDFRENETMLEELASRYVHAGPLERENRIADWYART